jgi:nucleoid-associated protein YgaU
MMAQAQKAQQEFSTNQARQAEEAETAAKAAAAAAVIKHVWTSEDTYAGLAFKYYKSIQEPYWRLIYNQNKAIIGNHPNDIRVGLEIEIPPLSEELKKN